MPDPLGKPSDYIGLGSADPNNFYNFYESDKSLRSASLRSEPPSNSFFGDLFRRPSNLPKGAELLTPKSKVNFKSNFTKQGKDLRAKLKVPRDYLKERTKGYAYAFEKYQGILFPYTPTIGIEFKADYATQNPIHSNFAQYFYQRSSVSSINFNAKFTVQNQKDADFYLSALMLLRSLTKMQVGKDLRAGNPPPICRLSAYGPFMFENVPVVVQSVRVDLPDSVDYWTIGKNLNYAFGANSVPTFSTVAITFVPMYSRDEMYNFSVDQFLEEGPDSEFRKKGYL